MKQTMRKFFVPAIMLLILAILPVACSDDDDVVLCQVEVKLEYSDYLTAREGVEVVLTNSASANTQSGFKAFTTADGVARFAVTPGAYSISTSTVVDEPGYRYIANGTLQQVIIEPNKVNEITLPVVVTRQNQDSNAASVIIKELYNGGCPRGTGSGFFQFDKAIILYNNGGETAALHNLCIGMLDPYNGHATNDWISNGTLAYASENYLPLSDGLWYFTEPLIIEPYSQVVVNLGGAIDNTATHPQSVNYANAAYYTTYDPESGYENTLYYPTPSEVIPSSQYLKAVRWGQSNAWALSNSSPALVLFQTKDVDPKTFATNTANVIYTPGRPETAVYTNIKLPREWVLDGMEVWQTSNVSNSNKRITSDIDGGYVALTNRLGHSLYRNVDAAKTQDIEGNVGKLVFNYSKGVDASTDPSGIDAEASIKNGAKIVYKDTNNSTNDFHERAQISLRD